MNKTELKDIVILIPSLDPDDKMPTYVKELRNAGAKHILVVDDGSKKENQKYFNEIEKYKEVTVLRHVVNQGKGRALKTGINYVLENYPKCKGIVTADADGQHLTKDTIKVAKRLLKTNKIVFGTRDFNEEIVPFKSRNGNKITTKVFKLLYGKTINDTQTGLRGLPYVFLADCMKLEGERFEYEISMLIKAVRDNREIIEEKIETVYFNSNRETHFDTFKDSFKIYRIMFSEFIKYSLSSLSCAAIDWLIYTLLINTLFNALNINIGVLLSTIVARIVSSLMNYYLNRTSVFSSNSDVKESLKKYYILVVVQMFMSWLLITFVYSKLSIDTSVIKIFVDTLIFFVNYIVQRIWVFNK